MRIREFSTEIWLPLPPEKLFPFFADAGNLDALTPPWLNFHIVTPLPVTMHTATLIDYRLRVRGVPVRWRTHIKAWQPPYRFVDEQILNSYRQWIHEHTFEPRSGGTLTRDLVRYAAPFDFLVHRWLVRPDVEKNLRIARKCWRKNFPTDEMNVAGAASLRGKAATIDL